MLQVEETKYHFLSLPFYTGSTSTTKKTVEATESWKVGSSELNKSEENKRGIMRMMVKLTATNK